jgi:tetratricopeptide (TPR) repeat protein
MIGGAAELCWDEWPLDHPAVVPDRMPSGQRACRRGGTFEAGLVTLRPDEWLRIEPAARRADTGLRVVCGASGRGELQAAIPGVAALAGPGADPDALWAKAVELRPDDPKVYAARAQVRSRKGRFAEAAADYAAATRLDPTDHYSWYVGAIAALYAGDMADYRAACRAMLSRFGRTTVPERADRTAKTCLLDPEVTADPAAMATVQRLADLAVGPDTNKAHLPYFRLTKGMAEYRAGRHASAVTWLTKVRETAAYAGTAELADIYLAMAYHRLGRGVEASASLDRAAAALRRYPDPSRPAADLPDGPDLLAPHIALREARKMFGAAAGDAAR